MHRVLLQRGRSLHSISCSTAHQGSAHLKMRLCIACDPSCCITWMSGTSAQESWAWCSAAPPGSCREERDACTPLQTKTLHQYCSCAKHLGSCIRKQKSRAVPTIKAVKKMQFIWFKAWLKAYCNHWGSLCQLSKALSSLLGELTSSFSPETWGFMRHRLPIAWEHFLWIFLIFVVAVKFLMPKQWHLKNFST